jgi:hypothetical protein
MPTADYRYRLEMRKSTFALAVTHEILNFIDYDSHFKEAAAAQRGETWYHGLMEIWTVTRDYFDDVTGKAAIRARLQAAKGKAKAAAKKTGKAVKVV